MPIVKQTLHPEGDTGTDIYPKTSTDQITDLPQSAKSQLYAHYITINDNTSLNLQTIYVSIYFVNSQSSKIESFEALKDAIKSDLEIMGYFKDSTNREGFICGGNYSPSSNTISVMVKSDTGFFYTALNNVASPESLIWRDSPVALGSNAG